MTAKCDGCKFWSELIAYSHRNTGPVRAMCLNNQSPKHSRMVRCGCDEYQPGEPVDRDQRYSEDDPPWRPGLDAMYSLRRGE